MSRAGNPELLARVIQSLEEDIIFARLRPRERLVEDDLMQRFQAKRHIIRQAIAALEGMGIVVKIPHKGAVVKDFHVAEVEHLYEMRELLQERAARRLPLPADPALLANLREIQARHAQAVADNDLRAVYRLNNAFHDTLFGACGNPLLAEAIVQYAWRAHPVRSYRIADPALLAQARDEHYAIIKVLEQGDREALVRLCVEHIRPSKEAYRQLHGWA